MCHFGCRARADCMRADYVSVTLCCGILRAAFERNRQMNDCGSRTLHSLEVFYTSQLGFTGIKLTLKAPTTTAADDIDKYFFIVFQRWIHVKNQAFFSSKDKCRLLQFLFGAFRVKFKHRLILPVQIRFYLIRYPIASPRSKFIFICS